MKPKYSKSRWKKGFKSRRQSLKGNQGRSPKSNRGRSLKKIQDKAQERIEGKVQKQIKGDAQKRETTAEYRGYLLVYIPTSVCEDHKTEKPHNLSFVTMVVGKAFLFHCRPAPSKLPFAFSDVSLWQRSQTFHWWMA